MISFELLMTARAAAAGGAAGGGSAGGDLTRHCNTGMAAWHPLMVISRTVLGHADGSHTECAADNNAEIPLLERI